MNKAYRILVAMDSFKGSMSSRQAIEAVRSILGDHDVCGVVVSDGGEGFLDALSYDGKTTCFLVKSRNSYGVFQESMVAVDQSGAKGFIEVATSIGIGHLKQEELDPTRHSSIGVGDQILALADRGCREITIGLGGSCTNDGGFGMLQALGVVFRDRDGHILPVLPIQLDNIAEIDLSGLDPRVSDIRFIGACDVTNPLLGKQGCSAIFGPQKGLAEADITAADQAMENYHQLTMIVLDKDVSENTGAGAAGGLGYALLAYLNGTYQSGLDCIARHTGLSGLLQSCDLVFTGEGRLDHQSLTGKAPIGIVRLAAQENKPSVFFYGSVDRTLDTELAAYPRTVFMPISDGILTLEQSIQQGTKLFRTSALRVLQLLNLMQS